VGKLVLADNYPDTYEILSTRAEEQNVSVGEFEPATLGTHHAEVGAYLLWLWGIPEGLTEVVARHHTPSAGPGPIPPPVLIVHVADALVNRRGDTIQMEGLEAAGWSGHLPRWRNIWAETSQRILAR